MDSRISENRDAARRRQRAIATIKQRLRDLRIQLALLNHRVGARLDLNDVDLDCLDLIARLGPLSPSALARRAGLHAATITGIIDRLERGGWVTRERALNDRRAIVVRVRRERIGDVVRLYAGMNTAMDQILGDYGEAHLELLADFLQRTVDAGGSATDELAGD